MSSLLSRIASNHPNSNIDLVKFNRFLLEKLDLNPNICRKRDLGVVSWLTRLSTLPSPLSPFSSWSGSHGRTTSLRTGGRHPPVSMNMDEGTLHHAHPHDAGLDDDDDSGEEGEPRLHEYV